MDYLSQVRRGIDFVEEQLGEEFSLADVSRAAGVSHWHFLRMFKALTNETLASYVRSRRLARARIELLETTDGVLAIALRAGFESQASFTRAFRSAFGMPPAKYRKLGGQKVHLHKLRIDEDYIRHLHRGVSLEPEIRELPSRHVVGCATDFFGAGSERNNVGEKLPALWDAFLPQRDRIERTVGTTCFGVITQTETDEERLEYVAAMQVERAPHSLPDGMVHRELGPATYAVFTHTGRAADVDRTVSYIYASWLMHSQYRHSYGPDLEVYDERWRGDTPQSAFDYAIPIQPR